MSYYTIFTYFLQNGYVTISIDSDSTVKEPYDMYYSITNNSFIEFKVMQKRLITVNVHRGWMLFHCLSKQIN